MEGVLRILYLEDDPLDAELVLRLLEQDGLMAEIDRVDTLADFRAALAHESRYALILADYSIPGLDAEAALKEARQTRPELPFVFLTGTVGEETAIEMLKQGANDYVLKQRIKRLAPAVRRALREAEEQALRKQAEEDLKRAKEVAEEANRAKSQFLANISHELRTPMTVIMGALQFLREIDVPPTARKMVEMGEIAARRLLGIIDDLLDVSRIEAHRLKIEARAFDIRECVRQAVEMFAIEARQKGLHLHWEVSSRLAAEVIGDPHRLGQILINLIGNAVKFTKEGEIAVSVAEGAEGIVFSIRDTGIGIPTGKMELLFEPFTQADDSLTRRYGGVGLGLAICRELVAMMGGTMRAESEEGRGSTFSFTLPLRPVESVHPSPPPARGAAAGRPVRVLLAEDDPMVQDLIEMLLRRRGWDVEFADTGRQAVSRWQTGEIDLILMDVQMPDMNGIEATQTIRQGEGEGGKHTCIIGLTAHAGREVEEECLASGMDRVLIKPVRIEDLYSAVEICVSG